MVGTAQSDRAALGALAFGAVCISFAAIFVKMIGSDVMGPTAIGFWRVFLGAVILFSWSLIARKSLRMPRIVLGWSIVAGFVFFLDLFFWHRSIFYSGAGMATILANTQVFVTAFWSFIVFKETLRGKFFVAAASAVLGVCLLIGLGSDVGFGEQYVAGIVFGLLTAVAYSSYLIIMKVIGHRRDHPDFRVVMAWTSLFTAFFLGVSCAIESDRFLPPDLYTLGVLVALAFVAQSLGWWVISVTLPKLDASRSGLALLLQPLLATVWGVMFFSEYLTVTQVLGAAITLAAIYVGSVRTSAH